MANVGQELDHAHDLALEVDGPSTDLVRDLASVAHRPSQVWAKKMRSLLFEMNDAAHASRAAGRVHLPRRQGDDLLARYDVIVMEALAANKPLLSRERNSLERESCNLAIALQRRRRR